MRHPSNVYTYNDDEQHVAPHTLRLGICFHDIICSCSRFKTLHGVKSMCITCFYITSFDIWYASAQLVLVYVMVRNVIFLAGWQVSLSFGCIEQYISSLGCALVQYQHMLTFLDLSVWIAWFALVYWNLPISVSSWLRALRLHVAYHDRVQL